MMTEEVTTALPHPAGTSAAVRTIWALLQPLNNVMMVGICGGEQLLHLVCLHLDKDYTTTK